MYLICSQGHQWQLAAGSPEVCPRCGCAAASDPHATFPLGPNKPSPPAASAGAPWPCVPGYEILGELGRGGMGVVYQARQVGLDRVVAVKMLGSGPAGDAAALARFRSEAEAVARLQHPNIIQVYEVGSCAAGPYYVMEFAAGGSLADVWEGDPQPVREAAELIWTLARAVHAAHEKGIIHRDLKPANILIQDRTRRDADLADLRGSEEDLTLIRDHPPNSRPSASPFFPKITDFGVARRMDAADGLTQTGQVMGTPGYMAPEQAEGPGAAVGPAADVYALGVLLYEGLTGGPPFRGLSALETLHLMLQQDPLPPSRLRPRLPRDLETICLRCLHREPHRRYPTARALAEDLGRFLGGRPIVARPTPGWERAWKWARRRPTIAALAASVFLLAAVSLVLVTWLWRHAEAAQERTEKERTRAVEIARAEAQARREAQLLSSRLLLERGISLCEAGEHGPGLLWLAQSLQTAPDDAEDFRRSVRQLLGGWGSQLHRPRFCLHQEGKNETAVLSPDGRVYLTAAGERVERWEAATGRSLGPPLAHPARVTALALGPDGRTVLTACAGEAYLWDVDTGSPRGKTLGHGGAIRAVAFSPTGQTVLTGGANGGARLWDAATGRPVGEVMKHGSVVRTLAFSPDGRVVLTGGERTARLWDATTGKPRGDPLSHGGAVRALAFRPDGRVFATASNDHKARLWDAETGKLLRTLGDHSAPVSALAFSPDGRTLVTAGEDHLALAWDADSGAARARLRHEHAVNAVAFSPDGSLAATGSEDHTARLWCARTWQPLGAPLPHQEEVHAVAFTPGGRGLFTASDDRNAFLWDIQRVQPVGQPLIHPASVISLALHPDGRTVLTACSDGTARLWDANGAALRAVGLGNTPLAVGFHPDGKTFLTGGWDRAVRFWDTATGQAVGSPLPHPAQIRAAAFSPDGKRVATGCEDPDGDVRLWDPARGEVVQRLVGHGRKISSVAFSPDGQTLVTTSWDRTARLWETATGQLLGEPLRHQDLVQSAAFSPDGKTVVTGSDDYTTRRWDSVTGAPQGFPLRHASKVEAVALSPDGRLLATGHKDRTVRLWDVAVGKPVGPPWPHDHEVHSLAFSPDGRTVLTACWDGSVRRWAVPPPREGSLSDVCLWLHVCTGLQLDAQGGVLVLDPPAWHEQFRRLGRSPAGE